jgi:nucleoside recognition membrane protein YjiH
MITNELVALFTFLLPGFITSFLFYALTSFPKKSELEVVVIALIYTIVINAVVEILGIIFIAIGNRFAIGEWNQLSKTIWSIITALGIGLLWSWLYNNDIIHKFLREFKITSKTSYPSEWYGAFYET